MKIIISHDVDHITVWEHKCDLIVPKFICRSFIEAALGSVSISEIRNKFSDLLNNKWENLEEITRFDRENDVPSTFFIGVNRGLGLCYSLKNAEYWAKEIAANGFDVGVHGINFDSFDGVKEEHDRFRQISGQRDLGIRMHYLRSSEDTLKFLNEAGYIFDSSLYKLENPYKVGDLWEFPLHIMDGHLFHNNKRWQNQNLGQVKDKTKKITDEADRKGIKYFTVLFHDRYFNDSFKSWKDWYVWMVDYFKSSRFEFISYREAIRELEKK